LEVVVMNLLRHSAFSLAIIGIVLAGHDTSHCATITLDASTKSASSDTASLEPGIVRSSGEQIGAYIQSKSMASQSLTVKIVGLKEARYDVYVNWGAFRMKRSKEIVKLSKGPDTTSNIEPGYVILDKPASDLAAGMQVQIPGRVVPTPLMRCVTSVQPTVKSMYDGLGASLAGEPGRARYTLGLAKDWVRSAISVEEVYRSVQLFVIPAGTAPKEMDWRLRLTTKATRAAAATTCSLLQDARGRMYANLSDPLLRESTLEALTPVEMGLRYYVQSQTPYVAVDIRNNCDLTISGALDLAVPKGWRLEKKPGLLHLKSGEIHVETLRLIPTSKGQTAPASLSATATIKVASGKEFAKLQIARRIGLSASTTTGGSSSRWKARMADGTEYVSCSHVLGAFAPCQPSEGNGLKSGEPWSGIHIPDHRPSGPFSVSCDGSARARPFPLSTQE
jgi:hypothetical protein